MRIAPNSPTDIHRRMLGAAAGHLRSFGFRDCYIARVLRIRQGYLKRLEEIYGLPAPTKITRRIVLRSCAREGCTNKISIDGRIKKHSTKYCSRECFDIAHGPKREYDEAITRLARSGASCRSIALQLGIDIRKVSRIRDRLRVEGKIQR